jgi:hypothetical protein
MRKTISIVLVLALCMIAKVTKADFTFGEPTNLGPKVNRTTSQWDVCISSDGLLLLWGSLEGYGGADIWMATRPTANDPWSEAANLGPRINTVSEETDPSLSTDGLTLFFRSNRPGGFGGQDLWVAKRADKESEWDTPTNLGPQVNTEWDEIKPNISGDGLSLYFSDYSWWEPTASPRPGGQGQGDIWVTTRASKDDPWESPVNLGPMVNSSAVDGGPCISADGSALFFFSNRSGGHGSHDIWISTRLTSELIPEGYWGTPINLGSIVNSQEYDKDPCISTNGSILYYDSGSNVIDIYQSQIIPIVDLNSDGIIDSADMCIMIDHWGTDESLCDIGPMPWGDGIVDVQDLIVLAEHLFEEVPLVQ